MPSSRIGYGYGAYSDADFGVEGVTQTGSASITVTATVTADGGKARTASAAVVALSTNTIVATRVRESDALVSSTASTASIGEEFILKLISEYDYGDGAYGYAAYGQGPLDTISTGSASATSAATRVREGAATSSVSSSTASSAVTVVDATATVSASASNTAHAVFTIVASGTSAASATITIDYIRERNIGALVSSTASISSLAREKWEPIAKSSQIWLKIA